MGTVDDIDSTAFLSGSRPDRVYAMKNPLTPGKSTPVKSWIDFALLARDARHFDTTVIEVVSSADHASVLKALNDANRPYAVCILKPR